MQITVRLLCIKSLVVLVERDIADELAKTFSDDLSYRARISEKTKRERERRTARETMKREIVPLGETIHPGKF